MDENEKIRVLLPHWIEHNSSHEKEFKKWAEILRNSGSQNIADLIEKAVSHMADAGQALSNALEKAGGPAPDIDTHHHHH